MMHATRADGYREASGMLSDAATRPLASWQALQIGYDHGRNGRCCGARCCHGRGRWNH